MSSINNMPLALRTNGPLPGYAELQQVLTAQQQPAQARQDDAPTAPLKRKATPEPVEATEPESPPSPFIKQEPKDPNTYSAFLLQDDDDQYDPAQLAPSTGARSLAATMEYDPARPVQQRRQTRFSRIMSSKGGDLFEPPTVCFIAPHRDDQSVHVLKCHGLIRTTKPQACGENCETVTKDDKILAKQTWVACTHPVCAEKREKRQAACFVPRKRMRTATPAIAGGNQGNKQHAEAAALRRSARNKQYDEKIAEMNHLVDTEPGYDILAEKLEFPGQMRKSRRHRGYAYKKEIDEDRLAERIHEVTGGLDLDLDAEDNPKLKREMKKLQVDGTDKLGGMAAAFGLKRKAEDEAAEFAKHDKPFGADLEKEKPWSYASSWNAKPGKKSIQNEIAPMFSIPETTRDKMIEEENGVTLEREDTVSHRLPRNLVDLTAEADDEDGAGIFKTVEGCQICGENGEEHIEECTRCHHHFHTSCAEASDDSKQADSARELQDDDIPLPCDGEGCGKPLIGIRYKCRNDACHHFDYCLDCFSKASAEHMQKMKEKGQDLAEHFFVAVQGASDELFNADNAPDEKPFICPDCHQNKRAQKMANQMLGKKPLAPKEIAAQVKKEGKAQKKAMAEKNVYAATKKRAENKRRSAITKPPSRRSSRVSTARSSSGAPGSSRRNAKIGNKTKAMAMLESVVEENARDVKMAEAGPGADES